MPSENKLEQFNTRVPSEVAEIFRNLCEKEGKSTYEKLQDLIADFCRIDLERGWVIKPKSNQE
ncbi:MAG: hypothetical protein KAU62_12060, partial [Candidatus Heimdallarchaeota archaeon]|nr:hypothetical protein [Candidatus Heimdallarchaeota archaeon]